MRQLLNVVLLFAILSPLPLIALPTDNAQKMHITADSTLFNYKTGFDVYEGNVTVVQGETRLTADRITTQKNSQHKIEEAIAYGIKNAAHYWTIPKKGDTLFHAQAKIIKFYPIKSTIELRNDAIISQGNNSFHGTVIIYNIKDQTVAAPATPNGRATIIIEPKQLKL